MEAQTLSEMDQVPIAETWAAMEYLVDYGLVKNIGVSNFSVGEITEIMALKELKYAPQVNQLELQPYFQRRDIAHYCQQRGLVVTAHTPLGGSANPWTDIHHQGKLLDDPVVSQIANEIGKTNAQVLLRWSLQKDFVVIPKSVNNDRLKSNFELYDFELTSDQINAIDLLDRGQRGCFNHPATPWLGRSLFPDELEALSK